MSKEDANKPPYHILEGEQLLTVVFSVRRSDLKLVVAQTVENML